MLIFLVKFCKFRVIRTDYHFMPLVKNSVRKIPVIMHGVISLEI